MMHVVLMSNYVYLNNFIFSAVLDLRLQEPSYSVREIDGSFNVCVVTGNQSLARRVLINLRSSGESAQGNNHVEKDDIVVNNVF